uniref:Uncharacterized protein n=1 Tax=Cannabis sativa TaxID=3483 RepID=A0A803R364_CANSA
MGACHFSLQDEVMITQRNGDIGAYIPQETNYIEERKIWALVPLRKVGALRFHFFPIFVLLFLVKYYNSFFVNFAE